LTFQVALAFLSSFPSKLLSKPKKAFGSNVCDIAVWLKWWSEASTANEHDVNGKYMGVYAALQAAALAASALVTW